MDPNDGSGQKKRPHQMAPLQLESFYGWKDTLCQTCNPCYTHMPPNIESY